MARFAPAASATSSSQAFPAWLACSLLCRVAALLAQLEGWELDYTVFARDVPPGKDCRCRLLRARAWAGRLPGAGVWLCVQLCGLKVVRWQQAACMTCISRILLGYAFDLSAPYRTAIQVLCPPLLPLLCTTQMRSAPQCWQLSWWATGSCAAWCGC